MGSEEEQAGEAVESPVLAAYPRLRHPPPPRVQVRHIALDRRLVRRLINPLLGFAIERSTDCVGRRGVTTRTRSGDRPMK